MDRFAKEGVRPVIRKLITKVCPTACVEVNLTLAPVPCSYSSSETKTKDRPEGVRP